MLTQVKEELIAFIKFLDLETISFIHIFCVSSLIFPIYFFFLRRKHLSKNFCFLNNPERRQIKIRRRYWRILQFSILGFFCFWALTGNMPHKDLILFLYEWL